MRHSHAIFTRTLSKADNEREMRLLTSLMLAAVHTASAAKVRRMSPDAAYKAVRKQTHERLFILLSDSDFSNAEGQQHRASFDVAARAWDSDNITFVHTIYDSTTAMSQQAGATKPPAYILVVREWFPRHVTHTDPMSSDEILHFLHFQLSFRAGTLHQSAKYFSASSMAAYAAVRPLGSIVLGLCETQAQEQEIAFAARRAAVPLFLRLGNASVARSLGAPFPAVLVVHGHKDESISEVAWPHFKPHYDHGEYFWHGLEIFLTERAVPTLVPISSGDGRFRRSLRASRYALTVYLVHNQRGRWQAAQLEPEQARAVSSESSAAMEAVRAVAPSFLGVVSFVSIDWFDEGGREMLQATLGALSSSASTSEARQRMDEGTLPCLLAIKGRFGRHASERRPWARWEKLQLRRKHRGTVDATGQLNPTEMAAMVRAFVDKSLTEAAVLATPPPDVSMWRGSDEKKEL